METVLSLDFGVRAERAEKVAPFGVIFYLCYFFRFFQGQKQNSAEKHCDIYQSGVFRSNMLYLIFMKRRDAEQEANKTLTSLMSFATTYNKTLPVGFPHASGKDFRAFQMAYPVLFKDGNSWSIDKHRKRFMDWHSTHHKK